MTFAGLLIATNISAQDVSITKAQEKTLEEMGYTLGVDVEPRKSLSSGRKTTEVFSSGLIPGKVYWHIDIDGEGNFLEGWLFNGNKQETYCSYFVDDKGLSNGKKFLDALHGDPRYCRGLNIIESKVRAFDYVRRKRVR